MANTSIQILRSYANTVPQSLSDGELAYSFVSNTLFIGDQYNNIVPIGGQLFANNINLAYNQANAAYIRANAAYTLANSGGSSLQNTASIVTAGDLIVSGNLNVLGTTVTINTEIVNQQEIIAGKLTANANIASVNTDTGSIVVFGGIGVSGNVYANSVYSSNVYGTIDGGGF